MKYLRIIVMTLVCMGFFSCEKRHVDDNLYDSAVVIVNNGLQAVSMYDLEGKTHSFTINTYCSGFYDANPNVRLVYNMPGVLDSYNEANGTSYRLLPENCYKLDSRHQLMEDKKVAFTVTFDCDKIAALAEDPSYSDIQDYVIPYTLVSESEGVTDALAADAGNIFIKPELRCMRFVLSGPKSSEVNLVDDTWYVMPFRLNTEVENKWGVAHGFEMEFVDQDGVKLAPEKFSVTCTSEAKSFNKGVSELTYELKIHKSMLKDATTWVDIKATAGVVDDKEHILVEDVTNWKFEMYSLMDCSDIPDSQLDWNTWNAGSDGNPNTHPRNIFDGETTGVINGKRDGNTQIWQGHNAANTPPEGGESYVNKGYTAPFVGINFGKEVDIHSLTVITPREINWGTVRAGGFNFDWDKKVFELSEEEKANVTGTPGQWKFGLGNNQPSSYDESKVDEAKAALEAQLSEWCEVIFNWDLVHNKQVQRGSRTADNEVKDVRYQELHPIIVDRKTQYLQFVVIPGWWDFPSWNGFGNGSIFEVAELEIIVNAPGVSQVK